MTTSTNTNFRDFTRAQLGISAFALVAALVCPAQATTNTHINLGPEARTRQICERIVRVGPGEAAFAQCVDSLASSLAISGQTASVQPIRIAGSEEDDGLPYYVNSPSMQFYRDQQACTQLGLTARAETNCVMDLAASLQDISNPAN